MSEGAKVTTSQIDIKKAEFFLWFLTRVSSILLGKKAKRKDRILLENELCEAISNPNTELSKLYVELLAIFLKDGVVKLTKIEVNENIK